MALIKVQSFASHLCCYDYKNEFFFICRGQRACHSSSVKHSLFILCSTLEPSRRRPVFGDAHRSPYRYERRIKINLSHGVQTEKYATHHSSPHHSSPHHETTDNMYDAFLSDVFPSVTNDRLMRRLRRRRTVTALFRARARSETTPPCQQLTADWVSRRKKKQKVYHKVNTFGRRLLDSIFSRTPRRFRVAAMGAAPLASQHAIVIIDPRVPPLLFYQYGRAHKKLLMQRMI